MYFPAQIHPARIIKCEITVYLLIFGARYFAHAENDSCRYEKRHFQKSDFLAFLRPKDPSAPLSCSQSLLTLWDLISFEMELPLSLYVLISVYKHY